MFFNPFWTKKILLSSGCLISATSFFLRLGNCGLQEKDIAKSGKCFVKHPVKKSFDTPLKEGTDKNLRKIFEGYFIFYTSKFLYSCPNSFAGNHERVLGTFRQDRVQHPCGHRLTHATSFDGCQSYPLSLVSITAGFFTIAPIAKIATCG